MYTVADYGQMIADRARTDAYAEALRRTVRPDSVVLDIGTGTGMFALLACQYGARKVYALETDDVIHLARGLAAANGYAERIQFVQEPSTRVSLPEKADILVSDLHGLLPLFERHIPTVIDARERLLAPGGRMIPQRDLLRAAVATLPDSCSRFRQPFATNAYGLDLSAGQRAITNFLHRLAIKPEHLLTEPQTWAVLDFSAIQSPNVKAELNWTMQRDGTGHGLSVWFDAELLDGIGFSNAPGIACKVYGQGFLPWSSPVELHSGDTVSVALQANLVGDDYVWSWNSDIHDAAGATRRQFRQSTLQGALFSTAQLRRHADHHVPQRNAEGDLDLKILELMDGNTSLEEIARRITAQYPDRFATTQEALNHVWKLSKQYSR